MITTGSFAAALGYLAVAYILVFQARIGPVVNSFDEAGGHGIHAGDMLALPLVMFAGLMFMMGVLACDRAVRPRSRTPWRVTVA